MVHQSGVRPSTRLRAPFNREVTLFPASGYRNNNDGSLNNVGNNGYYWSAVPNNTNNGCNLNFNSGNVNPQNNNNRSYGFSVRPVSEFTARRRSFSFHAAHALFSNNYNHIVMTISDEQLLQDIFRAYYDARRNKRNTGSQVKFEMDLEHNLVGLYEEIRTRTYRPSPCICFITFDPVRREVFASTFRDRVVHHLLFNYIAPLFETTFIHDSYSCRREKGTLWGIERFEHHLRSCTENYTREAYVLKLDIKGYFMSIDKRQLHGIIIQEIERKTCVRGKWNNRLDKELVGFLLDRILLRDPKAGVRLVGRPEDWEGLPPSKSLFHSAPGTGLPIGDLTSQLFSNIYLNRLDTFAKRTLHCRHYGSNVDDALTIRLTDTKNKEFSVSAKL